MKSKKTFLLMGGAAAAAVALAWFATVRPPALTQATRPQSRPETPKALTKEAMLRGVIHGAIAPHYAEMNHAFAALSVACDEFAAAPTEPALQKTRAAWCAAMIAWKKALTFPAGPLTDLDHLNNMHFWPIRPAGIEKLLQDAQPLDHARMESLGAATTGLAALEYLLFDLKSSDAGVLRKFSDSPGERRRQFATLLARELKDKASQVAKDWSPDGKNYGETFAKGGQASVNLLVNHLLFAQEGPTDGRLRSVIALHSSKMLQPELIESAPGLVSLLTLIATFQGCHEIYHGGNETGLNDFLKEHNPGLGEKIEAQFVRAIAALTAIEEPLEKAVTTPSKKLTLMRAYDECKALEVLIKVDLVSAMGVTLTFSANDGD